MTSISPRRVVEGYVVHNYIIALHSALHDAQTLHHPARARATMNSYEVQRLENIKHNQKLLAELNLHSNKSNVASNADVKAPAAKRRKLVNSPSRTSARIASAARPSYNEGGREKFMYVERVSPDERKDRAVES